MKRSRFALVLATAIASALAASGGAWAQGPAMFSTQLSGAEEVPARSTPATGTFTFTTDGTRLSYDLTVSNIRNVVAAHIHLGRPVENGPIVLTLATRTPTTGVFSGVLASQANISPPLEGPLAGQPLSLLLAHMAAGNTYVNVHTNDAVDPPNTGPGDFPGGEIRGPLLVAGSQSPQQALDALFASLGEEDNTPGSKRGRKK